MALWLGVQKSPDSLAVLSLTSRICQKFLLDVLLLGNGDWLGAFYLLTQIIMSKLSTRPQYQPDAPRSNFKRPRRAPFEFYPTPPEATRALLSVENFDGDIWEPACGNGDMSRELEAAGYSVVSTDLIQRDFGKGGVNFLKTDKPLAKNIITNPPYGKHGLADAFVRKALLYTRETRGSVAMLFNLRSLCHPDRTAKFTKTPPAAIYALDELTCWPEGKLQLQDIITSEPNSLRAAVASEALDHDDIKGFFSDLLQHGCISGMIGSLIYYTDTHKFFDTHYNAIEDLREEYEFNIGEPLQIKNDLKNFLAWFGFEETAYQMTLELGLEV